MPETPRSLGYLLPAEWHPHSATLMHWPSNRETWPAERLPLVEKVYLEIIEVLHLYEPIHLVVENKGVYDRVMELIEKRAIDLNRIIFHIQPINDVWARDCGPIFVRRNQAGNEEYAIIDWEYNAWGGKYPPFDSDNRIPEYIASKFGIRRFKPGVVLEGGSIETNGRRVLLTTESVLLNPNRNPGMNRQEIEQKLKEYLGVEEIIWLKEGLAGDDTDGHIDDLARFVREDTILAVTTDDPKDLNYSALQENLDILHKTRFNIATLPLPQTKIEGTTVDGSEYVPASYANFYIANGVVLVPLYDNRFDQLAMDLFARFFPEREVAGIHCSDLVWGQGSIHCITQQLYGI
ncbi:MAG: agmatine deiminase family protein [Balneolaceae bacterium]